MTRLERPRFTYSASYLNLDMSFVDEGTRDLTGAPTTGFGRHDGAKGALVPAMFVTYPVGKDLTAGFGISAPFGLGTDYGETWAGRYFATETKALLLNFNPSLALQIDEHWSVGVGLNAQNAQAVFANMIDFGTIGAGAGLGLKPQRADGRLRLEGDGWGFGYDLGVLWQPCTGTRIGTAFRSHIDHTINSRADFTVPPAARPLTAGGAFTDTHADVKVSAPASWALSAYHELDTKWAVVGDVTWMGWSRVDDLVIDFGNRAQPTIVQETAWKNTFRWSLGAVHKLDEDWTLRFGLALTDTPTRTRTRDARIPDEDRAWATAGVSWKVSESVTLDFAYAYIRVIRAAQIELDSPLAGHLEGGGHWKPVHTVSVGLNLDF